MTEQMCLNVRLTIEGVKEAPEKGILMDMTVADDNSYTVNKMVFLQEDLETGLRDWVVIPKEEYEFRLSVLKNDLEKEIIRAKSDPIYKKEREVYRRIINSTTEDMV